MLRKRQYNILLFIYKMQNNNGYPPTIREIGNAVGLSSTSTVHGHIKRLKKNGLIRKESTKTRAIEITKKGLKILGVFSDEKKVPIAGTVTAGMPILAVEENAKDFFPLPQSLKGFQGNLFALRVSGTSMINIGILDGDLIFVNKQNYAENGQIVVAMTDDLGDGDEEATVKRFFKEKGHYRLQPENDNMRPIIVKNVNVLGIVVGLYRNKIL